MASPEVRSDQSRGSTQDRGVGAGMMLSPQRESSGQKADLSALGGGALGMHALAQTVIAGKTVYLQGAKISPAQVVVDNKKVQLRSGVFLLAQLDADIDENADGNHRAEVDGAPAETRSHWEIDYRKIIGIYRNFDGKLLHSYFTTVSEVFLELIAPLRSFQRCFGS